MNDRLVVYLERLHGGHVQEFDELVEPELLELSEKDLLFQEPVHVEGKAYVADGWLILDLGIETKVGMGCSLCDTSMLVDITLTHVVIEEAIENIRGAVFDFSGRVREAILLEVPFYPQCGGKECLNRKEIEKYLRKENASSHKEDRGNNPFQDLM